MHIVSVLCLIFSLVTVSKTPCSVCVKLFPYHVWVWVWVNWPLLCNKSSICRTLLRLSSETNFMNENTTHKHSYVRLTSIVISITHFRWKTSHSHLLCLFLSLSIVFVHIRPTISTTVWRQQLLIDCTAHAYLCSDGVNGCQPNISANNPNSFLYWGFYCRSIKVAVCVPISGSSHRNSHTVLLSYCTNCAQSWTILNFVWASRWTILLLLVCNIVFILYTHEMKWFSLFSMHKIGLELVILILFGQFVLNQVEVFRFHSGHTKNRNMYDTPINGTFGIS